VDERLSAQRGHKHNSLKFDVIAARTEHDAHDALNEQSKLVSGAIENIGEEPTFSLLDGKQVVRREEHKRSYHHVRRSCSIT
jgi:hypothetical protein